MFTFALSADETRDTVLSCDPAVSQTDDETLSAFRRDWDESALTLNGEPTRWRVKALTEHVLYIDRWMREFVAVGVMVIDGEGNPQPALEAIERIRPAHLQTTVLTELCLRVRMISTMDLEKKT